MPSLQQSLIYRSSGSLSYVALFLLLSVSLGHGGNYLTSAHGNSDYGVYRTFTKDLDYARGNCAHCHEQHASVNGNSHAPYPYGLFADNHTSQTENVCLECHTELGSVQFGGIVNRSYSYRAGGYTDDSLNDIAEAFSSGSSHNLNDIQTFISSRWGYNSLSNPCAGCHNPHAAQGDPANSAFSANSAKTSLSRGYPVALPSTHNSGWPRWGDDDTERMDDFTNRYQAPYRVGGSELNPIFEPDGSAIVNGSNLTDYNTFCLDCHGVEVSVTSSATVSANPGTTAGKLSAIDWANEKHGMGDADVQFLAEAPYDPDPDAMGYVLSCVDCHEPHGSGNFFLLREVINGTAVVIDGGSQPDGYDLGSLCEKCHNPDGLSWETIHHGTDDKSYNQAAGPGGCMGCHPIGTEKHNCISCHFHGGITGVSDIPQTTVGPTDRRTF